MKPQTFVKEIEDKSYVLVSGHLYGIGAPEAAPSAGSLPDDEAVPARRVESEAHLCPGCHTGNLRRIPRSRLMRIFPDSRHYACPFCRSTYLFFLGGRKIRLSRNRRERHVRMSLFGSRALTVHWEPGLGN